MNRPHRLLHAFTLVELLVVITIIVVLLGLLAPALDRAIYQAELAVCGAQMKTMGNGLIQYGFDHKRKYPYRKAVHVEGDHWWVNNIMGRAASGELYDERSLTQGYFDVTLFLDPLTDTNLDIETIEHETTEIQYISVPYFLWYGFNNIGGKGMFKIGDKFSAREAGGNSQVRVNWLISDFETVYPGNARAGHPDSSRVLSLVSQQQVPINWDEPFGRFTTTIWGSSNHERGMVDLNALGDDGAVIRTPQLGWQKDERMTLAPVTTLSTAAPNQANPFGHRVPK